MIWRDIGSESHPDYILSSVSGDYSVERILGSGWAAYKERVWIGQRQQRDAAKRVCEAHRQRTEGAEATHS
jgi:hypothetical protein